MSTSIIPEEFFSQNLIDKLTTITAEMSHLKEKDYNDEQIRQTAIDSILPDLEFLQEKLVSAQNFFKDKKRLIDFLPSVEKAECLKIFQEITELKPLFDRLRAESKNEPRKIGQSGRILSTYMYEELEKTLFGRTQKKNQSVSWKRAVQVLA